MASKADIYSQSMATDSQDTDRDSHLLNVSDANPDADHQPTQPLDSPVVVEPNHNPYRRRISDRSGGIIKKIARIIKNKVSPPPTMEEIAKMEEKKRAALLAKTLDSEARVLTKRVSRSLHELGFSYVRKDANGNISQARYITFDWVESTEDAHWLHVDMHHWPYGINSDQLLGQEVINHVSRSVGHKVNVRANPECGIWFVVERASGMMGIPIHVPIQDMWDHMPATATSLTVPIGMTNNRKVVYDNIDDMVHIMVAGQTGGGKSTLLNSWFCTLVKRNTPDQLRILMFDMKAGLEFQFYEGLPHLLKIPDLTDTGIITDPDQVQPALKWLMNVEAKHRLDTIRAAEHRDIKSYNVRRKNKMPRIVVVCDEWAMARMGKGGKEAEQELVKALQLLRAVGIHIIICTQVPTKDVLGLIARANLPTRVAFSCAELSASVLICSDNSAVGLSPAGRCIYRKINGNQPVQAPWISEGEVKNIVQAVITGKETEQTRKAHDVTLEEVLAWALHENQGSLRSPEVFSHFSSRGIVQKEIYGWLKDVEGKTVEIEGHVYKVEPGSGARPRRLVATVDQTTDNEEQEHAHA